MSNVSDNVRLAPDGSVYVAAVGTTLPTTATMGLNVAFKEAGFVSEDGIQLTPKVEFTDIMAWQSAVPVKTSLDTASFEIQFTMIEVKLDTWQLYFFNTTATNSFGQGKMAMLSNPGSQEKSVIIDWTDDSGDHNRLVLPKAVLSDRDNMSLVRNKAIATGVTFRALDSAGYFAYLYSTNPDLVPTT
jgi:hypothetical protein